MSTRREKRARRGLPGRVKVPQRARKRAEREALIEAIPDDVTVAEVLAVRLDPIEAIAITLVDQEILDMPAKRLMERLLK